MFEDLRRLHTYVGATLRVLRVQFRNPDTGAVVDLSGYDSAKVSAQEPGGDYRVSAKTATIEAGTDGWVNFTLDATEGGTKGDLFTQVKVYSGADFDYCDEFILEVRQARDSEA